MNYVCELQLCELNYNRFIAYVCMNIFISPSQKKGWERLKYLVEKEAIIKTTLFSIKVTVEVWVQKIS